MKKTKLNQGNNMRIIMIVSSLVFFCGIYSCSAQQVSNAHKKEGKQTFNYNNKNIIEEYFFLGILDLQKVEFRVYNCFKKIRTAEGYRGQSSLLFLSRKKTCLYLLDSPTDFPDSLSHGSLFNKGVGTKIIELPNPLCLDIGCFYLQVPPSQILQSLKFLK